MNLAKCAAAFSAGLSDPCTCARQNGRAGQAGAVSSTACAVARRPRAGEPASGTRAGGGPRMQGAGAVRQGQTAGAALSVEQAHSDKAEQHADYGEYGGVAPVVEGVRLRQHFAEGDVEHGPCGERERGGYDKQADAAHPDADDAAEQGGDAGERGGAVRPAPGACRPRAGARRCRSPPGYCAWRSVRRE